MAIANPVVGTATSYDLTQGIIVDMDEAIYLLTPQDAPLLGGFASDGRAVLPVQGAAQVKFEWMDEDTLTPRSTVAAAVVTADTVITVASGDRARFSTGDIVRLQTAGTNEVIRVTGYGTTADTLLVTKGFDGTATTAASGTLLIGLGTALPEGSDPQNGRYSDRTGRYNYLQIFGPTKIAMSATERIIPRYGVPSEWAHQMGNKNLELTIAREQAYLYGRRYNSTTTKIRTTGGLDYFIQTNVDSTSTQLTVLKMQALQQLAYNQGGVPDILVSNPASLLDVNDINNTDRVRTTLTETVRGRYPTMVIWTEFGPVDVVRNRYVNKSDAFLYKRDQTMRKVLRPMQFQMLAKTGDSDSGQMVSEEGLKVKGEQHMGKFTALVYT